MEGAIDLGRIVGILKSNRAVWGETNALIELANQQQSSIGSEEIVSEFDVNRFGKKIDVAFGCSVNSCDGFWLLEQLVLKPFEDTGGRFVLTS